MKFQNYDIQLGISVSRRNRHIVRKYADAGFEAAELLLNAGLSLPGSDLKALIDDGEETVALIRDGGLKLRTVHLPFSIYWNASSPDWHVRNAAIEGFKRVLEQVAGWGAPLAVMHVSCGTVPADERPLWEKTCKESLTALSGFAKSQGVRILAENLPNASLVNSSEMLWRVTDECNLAEICFDVNHLFRESHAEYISRLGKYILNTHLSDYDGFAEKHWIPGKGVVPWKQVFTMLEAVDYKGPYLFEVRNDENGQPYEPTALRDAFFAQIAD